MKKPTLKQQYRVNEQIRVREVRIVGDDIESCVISISKALQMAEKILFISIYFLQIFIFFSRIFKVSLHKFNFFYKNACIM